MRIAMLLSLLIAFCVNGEVTKLSDTSTGEPWANPPTEYRGIRFGMKEDEVKAIAGRLSCETVRTSPGTRDAPRRRVCTTSSKTYAFQVKKVSLPVTFHFQEDALGAISFAQRVRKLSFDEARPVFENEFGPATRETAVRHQSMEEMKIGDQIYPRRIDYVTTCALWESPSVNMSVCSVGDWFDEARIWKPDPSE